MKCFYHDDIDGFASAAVVANEMKNYQDSDYVKMNYVDPIPMDIIEEKETLFFVDYSFNESNLEALNSFIHKQCQIIWIDHHLSSISLLEKYPEYKLLDGVILPGKCGSILTYSYFHDREPIPKILKMINDFDCGYYKYGNKTMYLKYGLEPILQSPTDDLWKKLIYEKDKKGLLLSILERGKSICEYTEIENKHYIDAYGYESKLAGIDCFCVNKKTDHTIFGDRLRTYPLCASYVKRGDIYIYTIYTSREDIDCSKIAELFGGGGHKIAAGFRSKELLL